MEEDNMNVQVILKNKLWSFLLLILIIGTGMSSCKKADEKLFDHNANIYFYLNDYGIDNAEKYRKDSILYTFAYEPTLAKDTIFIPVRISGERTARARTFVVYAENDSSTAKVGMHYEPLQDTYTVPANFGIISIPLVVLNQDPLLKTRSVSVLLRLKETADFGIEVPSLNRVKVVFSAKLEKPDWWDVWSLGAYSQVKHQLFILASGQIHLTTAGTDAPKNTYYTGLLTTMLNDPFTWVEKNKAKGYVLDKQDDNTYYFYNQSNPAGKTTLKKNQQNGKFYFIDEKGLEII